MCICCGLLWEIISISLFLNYIFNGFEHWTIGCHLLTRDVVFWISAIGICQPFLFKNGIVRLCSDWTLCQGHSEWVVRISLEIPEYSSIQKQHPKLRKREMVKAIGLSFGRWQGGGYVILWDKMIIMFSQKRANIFSYR